MQKGMTERRARTFWGIPAWALLFGVIAGFVVSLIMFDAVLPSLIFGAAIGTVFALAFARSPRR